MAANNNNSNNNGNSNTNAVPAEEESVQVHYHTIDIRAFLVLIAVTMAASFLAGVMILPPPAVRSSSTNSINSLLGSGGDSLEDDARDVEADQHRPAGQHLLVDIKGVDSDFLNSEELLSKAMVDTVLESGLTMLSYHCHSLLPSGVSCVGVLLESHSE